MGAARREAAAAPGVLPRAGCHHPLTSCSTALPSKQVHHHATWLAPNKVPRLSCLGPCRQEGGCHRFLQQDHRAVRPQRLRCGAADCWVGAAAHFMRWCCRLRSTHDAAAAPCATGLPRGQHARVTGWAEVWASQAQFKCELFSFFQCGWNGCVQRGMLVQGTLPYVLHGCAPVAAAPWQCTAPAPLPPAGPLLPASPHIS